jgi:hypothetical protein
VLHGLSEAEVDTERQGRDKLGKSDTVSVILHAITIWALYSRNERPDGGFARK